MTPGSNLTKTVQSCLANVCVCVCVCVLVYLEMVCTATGREEGWKMRQKRSLEAVWWLWITGEQLARCLWGFVVCCQTRFSLSERSGTTGSAAKTHLRASWSLCAVSLPLFCLLFLLLQTIFRCFFFSWLFKFLQPNNFHSSSYLKHIYFLRFFVESKIFWRAERSFRVHFSVPLPKTVTS